MATKKHDGEAAAVEQPDATAESGRLPLVKLVASVRGFYGGCMVEPGQSFMFDPNPRVPGGKVKWPKWAAEPGKQAQKQPPQTAKAFDTRPIAAQRAAMAKQKGLAGTA